MVVSRSLWVLGVIGGIFAFSSIFLPWYHTRLFSFTLVHTLQPPSCPTGAYCALIPASPSLNLAFVCTIVGGCLGTVGSILFRNKSPKKSRALIILGLLVTAIGMIVSLEDSVVREGLSIGFYTDSFSAIFFIAHLFAHK